MYGRLSVSRSALRKSLGLKDKIPADFEGTFDFVPLVTRYNEPLGVFKVVVQKSHGSGRFKTSRHRVFVACTCGKLVPAGRMDQHRCASWPNEAAQEINSAALAKKALTPPPVPEWFKEQFINDVKTSLEGTGFSTEAIIRHLENGGTIHRRWINLGNSSLRLRS